MAENKRIVSVSQEPSNGDAVNPDVMCQISVSLPSTLYVIMSSSSMEDWHHEKGMSGDGRVPEKHNVKEWLWTEACFLLQFVFCCLPRLSRSIHPSRRGEKNGCNLFLTPFLNASLHHLHTFDRTLISDVKKARKRQTN
ncbi:hypothetical protein DPX16_4343 [Anabarilius grahami]|uniref:Uncharacterized protein n=1 Tax=Anabarilius grahami TaxID=495550 RepID=A0A3N0YSX5_ANAGA|nr:hypothetical protein DPX16_4343 [Anabarilius grahami]